MKKITKLPKKNKKKITNIINKTNKQTNHEKRSLPYTASFSNRILPPVTKDERKNFLIKDVRLTFLSNLSLFSSTFRPKNAKD